MAKGIPDNIFNMLAEADKKYNLPAGTMHSIMQQETGGNAKYLDNPTTYHYNLNADGKRIAGHTGKVSTAFGPFGILESTAADPGFGLKPLKDKTSLAEQMDFAAAYASKRGIAAYGEGEPYARQVAARIAKGTPATVVPAEVAPPVQSVQLAQAEAPVPTAVPVPVAQGSVPIGYTAPNVAGWNGLKEALPQEPVQVADLNFGIHGDVGMSRLPVPQRNVDPNFQAFGRWKARV